MLANDSAFPNENATDPASSAGQAPASSVGQAPQLYTITAGGFSATCDAFVRDPETDGLWFLSMVGSQTALKAIWAALLKQPPEAAFLIEGADGMAHSGGYQRCVVPDETIGTWTTKIARLPAAGGYHAMVYTRMAEFLFERDSFLLLAPSEQEAPALPPPLPRPPLRTALAPELGRLALAHGAGRRHGRALAVGGRQRLPLPTRPRPLARAPLRGGRLGPTCNQPCTRHSRNQERSNQMTDPDRQIVVTVQQGPDETARWWLPPEESSWQVAQIAEDLEDHLIGLVEANNPEEDNQ